MLRHSLVSLAAACLMPAAQLKVDHVTVAGKDLQAMQKTLSAARVPTEYGGPHANGATEMALASFPDGSYLELIALQPKADPKSAGAHGWSKFLEGNAGPCAWAVRPPDLAAEIERLRAAAIPVIGPTKNGRARPDGVHLEWETAQVGSGGNGTFFPFLIHDFTPRENRAYPSGKPTTVAIAGIVKVVIAVKNLDAAIAQYQQAYGLPAPQRQDDATFGAKLAWFAGTPVVLATPLPAGEWLTQRMERFGEAPCAFVLSRGQSAKYPVKPGSTWFGMPVSWFDAAVLGWRLGLE